MKLRKINGKLRRRNKIYGMRGKEWEDKEMQ